MPPKKDKNEATSVPETAEYNLKAMDLEELKGFVYRLQDDIEKTRQVRNNAQVAKDQMDLSLNNYQREIDKKNNEILLKEHEIKEGKKDLEKLLNNRKQNLTYMDYVHRNKLKDEEQIAKTQMETAEKESTKIQESLLEKLNEKVVEKNITINQYEDTFKDSNVKRIVNLKDSLIHREDKLRETINIYENMYNDLTKNLQLLKDVEVHEFKELKSKEYHEYLTVYHESMDNMKNYFNEIVGKSLSLIDTLKSQISELKISRSEMSALKAQILKDNKTLAHCIKDLRITKIKISHYEQDLKSDTFTQKRSRVYQNKIAELEKENMKILQDFKKCSQEYENLKVHFVASLRVIEEALGSKTRVLNDKTDEILKELHQLGENIQPLKLHDVNMQELRDFL